MQELARERLKKELAFDADGGLMDVNRAAKIVVNGTQMPVQP